MNAEVAAWYVQEIQDDDLSNPLRIVNKLPTNLCINILIPANISAKGKELFRCMGNHTDEVYKRPIKSFNRFCPSETLFLESISSILKTNLYVHILLSILPALLLLGMVINLFWSGKKKDQTNNGNDREKNLCCYK